MSRDLFKGSRISAIAARAKFYDNGEPCVHGHVAGRLTLDGYCCECRRIKQRQTRVKDKARLAPRSA